MIEPHEGETHFFLNCYCYPQPLRMRLRPDEPSIREPNFVETFQLLETY